MSLDPSGCGTVFELSNTGGTWTETILHNFADFPDGAYPNGKPIEDSTGNLYGVTSGGGTHSIGTVFELSQSGGSWVETVLYSFRGRRGSPIGRLIIDATGSIIGTTNFAHARGTVFKLTNVGGKWTESDPHRFSGTPDGRFPLAGVTEDSAGVIYGTTWLGGTYDWGTVFEITP